VGEDPASQVYVRNKQLACKKTGMSSDLKRLPATTTTTELLDLIQQLNQDPAVHGILVQLPVPKHIESERVLDAITPAKDVDAFHPYNVGLVAQGRPHFLPCTPFGVLQILKHGNCPTRGRRVCILGRSDIVGKPLANMLVQRSSPLGPDFANATVTLCHSQSPNLPEITRQADILIAAIGQPEWVKAEMVKPGAVVIDVGINRVASGLVGDVDFQQVAPIASAITPVPGGVGPLTVTMLLLNTLTAARMTCKRR
jgi:methylenetetrahydrofolate dehydrogenase (NADP+)/methenyltetrahydrofolate cyclohydrolase